MQIASRKVIAGLMVSALCITTLSSAGSDVEAKAKASLKTKKISVKVGKKKSILIKNKTKKHSYSFTSSNKQVAKVTSKGKVTGIKAGKATITVRITMRRIRMASTSARNVTAEAAAEAFMSAMQ